MKKLLIVGSLFLGLYVCKAYPASATDDLTGAHWMSLSQEQRLLYVIGYTEALQLLVRSFNWDVRTRERGGVTMDQFSERLYRRLLNERELRAGPVGEILFQTINETSVVTDRKGKNIPAWQKLLSTSDCAELLENYRADK